MKISIIIPCYNAIDKIGRCLASLRAIDMATGDYEVIMVDDYSTDGTFDLIQREAAREENWRVARLEKNSGSPSRPRNLGIALAKGDYVFFLDCDDEILPDTLRLHYEHALATKADIVRGYLLADDGRTRKAMNQLSDWRKTFSRQQRISTMIARQSTTNTSLIRRELLCARKILWPEDIRMSEDTVFLASVLAAAKHIEYIDHPTFIYNKMPALVASSTQSYGARELRDHLQAWRTTKDILAADGVDYVSSRLQIGLQSVLSALIFRNRGDIDESLFEDFCAFITAHWEIVSTFKYIDRYKEILLAVNSGNFAAFLSLCRPRLVIAGNDLKFIESALSNLERYFDVRLDRWLGHDTHNETKSIELLRWADLIWCEWLLGNAVWYAANKRAEQRLIVRMHRFELSRDFGDKLKMENVEAVTAVSVHFFERLLERYPNIPRAKARLLPNYVRLKDYRRDFSEKRLLTLGMIGILPARKRLDRALSILATLHRHDPRYRLEVFGRTPEEVRWVATDKAEMAHFERCRRFIAENGLDDAVSFHGHSDVKTMLAEKNVGFVLSVSESIREFPGFESFHLALADGFAAGGIGLALNWNGAEYVWPREFILPSEEEITARILSFRENPDAFRAASERGRKFIEERYGAEKFVAAASNLFRELA